MNILVTGGSGFLGARLARTLLAKGELALGGGAARPITSITLTDRAAPPQDLQDDPRVRFVGGDLNERLASRQLPEQGTDCVFHLLAAVSGECEADFDLGIRSNLAATAALLENCRGLGTQPTVVFASSLAVFGKLPDRPMFERIDDFSLPTPQSSYGIQKFIGEQLMADYGRKKFIRARSVRLMTVSVRPGRPNGAASGFLSGMLREPLAGLRAQVPVPASTVVALASPGRTIEGIIRAAEASDGEWGPLTAINLPALRTTVGDMAGALQRVAGADAIGLLDWTPDPAIERLVSTWPGEVGSVRARGLACYPTPTSRAWCASTRARTRRPSSCRCADAAGAARLHRRRFHRRYRPRKQPGARRHARHTAGGRAALASGRRCRRRGDRAQVAHHCGGGSDRPVARRPALAAGAGPRQFFFKYCSTFDSTPAGNTGPVTEALMDELGADFTVAAPAFPDNGRTVFKGHLFVGDVPLNESGMQNHPLTPMKDPNLVRVLQAQCRWKVGLLEHATVARGAEAILERSVALKAAGVRVAMVDAVSNEDLLRLGAALKDLRLVTGGSGLAIGLPANFGLDPSGAASDLPRAGGLRAIVSGSCSGATNRQVEEFVARGGAGLAVDPLRLATGQPVVQEALAWAEPRLAHGPVPVYSTAAADAVKAVQGRLGCEGAGELVEQALATIASGLVQCGVRQLVVAGGETSGACVQALGIEQLQMGPQIDPGVPWCHAAAGHAPGGLHLALKSGNFGSDDFFIKAFAKLA